MSKYFSSFSKHSNVDLNPRDFKKSFTNSRSDDIYKLKFFILILFKKIIIKLK